MDQNEWLTEHIPHRVRAATARLPMENSLLQVTASIDPALLTKEDEIYWRFATDAIWEGRLAATRWLIEFVGIKRSDNGKPIVSKPNKANKKNKNKNDVYLDEIDGGELLKPSQFLADVWKGCSQASMHATDGSNHPSVDDQEVLPKAFEIILEHLQATIYQSAGKNIRDYVLRVP